MEESSVTTANSQSSSSAPQGASTTNVTRVPVTWQAIEQLSIYPWDIDREYQQGLQTILQGISSQPAGSQMSEWDRYSLVWRTRCFYFTRKCRVPPIDHLTYMNRLQQKTSVDMHVSFKEVTPDQMEEFRRKWAVQVRTSSTNPAQSSTGDTTDQAAPSSSAPVPSTSFDSNATAARTSTNRLGKDSSLPSQGLESGLSPSSSQAQEQAQRSEQQQPPHSMSFAEVVDLITQGKPMPNIEEIPNTVLEIGSSKLDRTPRRQKPWETASSQATLDSNILSTDEIAPAIREMRTQQDTATPGGSEETGNDKVHTAGRTGQAVVKILQPDAIPDSGLLNRE